MADIKQYSLQLHEQIITLWCEEPKKLATLFRDRMFLFDTVLHLSVNAVADQREGGEKLGHREAAIFHQELQTNEWMQTYWSCVWKGYVTIFLFFFFGTVWLWNCVLVSRRCNGNNGCQSREEMVSYCCIQLLCVNVWGGWIIVFNECF